MRLVNRIRRASSSLVRKVARRVWPTRWKEFNELKYWTKRKAKEGTLVNKHYQYFYTTHFGFDDSDYSGKFILDIGCGPRGSLEWASMASRRIGLDPLAKEYLRLGAREHQMEYIDSPAESIPVEDAKCDVVASFNSLDHVKDIDRTLKEIKRITRPGGHFLLLVEVNHPPTDLEPHQLSPRKVVELLTPQFTCETLHVYRPVVPRDMYGSIRADVRLPNPEDTRERGFMSARFLRTSSS
jgi:SAM-dependent methyltransferase